MSVSPNPGIRKPNFDIDEKLSVKHAQHSFNISHPRGAEKNFLGSTFQRFHNDHSTVKPKTQIQKDEQLKIKENKEYLKASHITWSMRKNNEQFKTMNVHQREL